MASILIAPTQAEMQTLHRKAGSHLPAIAVLPAEEQIHRLIITPRQPSGQKLSAQLADGDANRLVTAANVAMTVERRLTGRAHLLKIHCSVSLSEARAIAARLATMHDVEVAEPDRIMRIDSVVPADPIYPMHGVSRSEAPPCVWRCLIPACCPIVIWRACYLAMILSVAPVWPTTAMVVTAMQATPAIGWPPANAAAVQRRPIQAGMARTLPAPSRRK